MNYNKIMASAAFIASLTGCQPTPPSFVKNANALLEKQISQIANDKAHCQYTSNSGFWLSACSLSGSHPTPLFALLEPEGVMQANDNLAIFVVSINDDARHFAKQPGFTIPVTVRKMPIDADKVIKSLSSAGL